LQSILHRVLKHYSINGKQKDIVHSTGSIERIKTELSNPIVSLAPPKPSEAQNASQNTISNVLTANLQATGDLNNQTHSSGIAKASPVVSNLSSLSDKHEEHLNDKKPLLGNLPSLSKPILGDLPPLSSKRAAPLKDLGPIDALLNSKNRDKKPQQAQSLDTNYEAGLDSPELFSGRPNAVSEPKTADDKSKLATAGDKAKNETTGDKSKGETSGDKAESSGETTDKSKLEKLRTDDKLQSSIPDYNLNTLE
jgi:hypothetical protein